jgi:DNA-binding NarL/FixJ family response regulator
VSDSKRPRDVVLVVDDSPDTLRFLTDALDQAGVTVLVATGGEQALALVERITPDIVLLDAVMPVIDGFETCRRLKAMRAVAHVPVIFMTGLTETEHIVEGLEAGGVDYLTKPIVLDELFARIRVHLANARTAQSARAALDSAGRYLLAVDPAGGVLWCTPQAMRLLDAAMPARDGVPVLPDGLRRWIAAGGGRGGEAPPFAIDRPDGPPLRFSFVGAVGGELLFRVVSSDDGDEVGALKKRFALTTREAEVLLWIARGKANRDIAEILALSPRTVNKHLEQIYAKLGVENRASAAVVAIGALGGG